MHRPASTPLRKSSTLPAKSLSPGSQAAPHSGPVAPTSLLPLSLSLPRLGPHLGLLLLDVLGALGEGDAAEVAALHPRLGAAAPARHLAAFAGALYIHHHPQGHRCQPFSTPMNGPLMVDGAAMLVQSTTVNVHALSIQLATTLGTCGPRFSRPLCMPLSYAPLVSSLSLF